MRLSHLAARVITALLLAFTLTARLAAQTTDGGGDDEYDFSDIPVDEEELPYIGVGGGYNLLISFMNFDEINTLGGRFNLDGMKGQLFMHGGGGWTAIGIIPNVRLGVYGGGGSKSVSRTLTVGDSSYVRTLQFSSGYTAAHLDYAIPIAGSFTIAPGVMVGGGGQTVKLTQTHEGGASYSSLFDVDAFQGAALGRDRTALTSRGNIFLFPVVNFEYALTQFIMIRAGGGYQFNFALGEWDDTQGTEILNMPDISANGPTVQVGLFLGLFQQ